MKEISAIVEAHGQLDHAKSRSALATVVRLEGSSYRRTGARMLVTDDGVWVGGISGGCLEGDALRRAKMAILREEASLVTYDTTEDDAHQIGVGLGCNGIIDVLFTPIRPDDPLNPIVVLQSCLNASRGVNVLLTIIANTAGIRGLKKGDVIHYNGPGCLSAIDDSSIRDQLVNLVNERIGSGESGVFDFTTVDTAGLTVFIEIVPPAIHLVLMGRQYDIYPLARLASEMAWPVTMITNPWKTDPKLLRFVVNVFDYSQFSSVDIDSYSAIVLMSHDYKTDKRNLPLALATHAFYVGMLGPRARSERIFAELNGEGLALTDDQTERIFAPAGLDIGAAIPEEIALSILAEIKAVMSNRAGSFLKLRQTAIHDRG